MNVLASLIKQGQRKFVVLALAGGVAASGTMVYTASNAAFNATTDNPTNAWNTGSVILTDDDSGVARFTINNMISNAGGGGTTLTGSKCIRVDYDGTSASTVKLYATAVTNDATTGGAHLGDYINLKIEQGTATSGTPNFATTADCVDNAKFGIDDATDGVIHDGSATSFASAYTSYGSGAAAGNAHAWTPSVNTDYRVYRITWDATSLPDTVAVQGKTFQCTFVWHARSA